jgi:hypothetical protein
METLFMLITFSSSHLCPYLGAGCRFSNSLSHRLNPRQYFGMLLFLLGLLFAKLTISGFPLLFFYLFVLFQSVSKCDRKGSRHTGIFDRKNHLLHTWPWGRDEV